MANRRIKITQEIIDQSFRANSSHCMIADAVRTAIPWARRVEVDLQTIRYTDGDDRMVFFTPRKAQLALVKFDQGDDDLAPFDFALGAPTQIVKRRERKEGPVDALTEKRREYAAAGGRKAQQKARIAKEAEKRAGTTKVGGTLPPTFTVKSNLGNRRMFGLRAVRA